MNNIARVDVLNNNGIAVVTFYHPKSNSLPAKLLHELSQKITTLSADENAKVLIVKSEGEKAFCAGASFDELISIDKYESGKSFFMGFAELINAMRKCPKLIIARVQGKAVGGGVGIAAAADYVFAHSSASVKLSELALGIGPFVVGPAVERKIGKSAFTEMSIDYDWKTADWAKSKGLFNNVYENISDLDKAVDDLTLKLSGSSTAAMEDLKRILWKGTEDWDELLERRAEISGRLVLSDFTKDYINSFKKNN